MKPTNEMVFFRATIIAILQLLTYSQGTKILHISEDAIKSLGSEIEFNCTVQDLDNHPLLWLKISDDRIEQNILTTNTNLLNPDERFSVNYDEISSTYSLKIRKLEASDEGIYQCQIPLSVKNKLSSEVKLNMELAPKIINVTTSSESINEGETISLECQAIGLPVPQITWRRKNYETIAVADRNSIRSDKLVIPNADRTDRGTYICIANNGVEPVAESPITVSVNFAPVVAAPRPRIAKAKGYSASLECHIEAYPPPTITWLKNGQTLATEAHNYPTDDFIRAYHVQLIGPEDYGYYTCRAENSLGMAETVIELYETEFDWKSPY